VANYRCEENSVQLGDAFEKDLEEHKGEVRDYQALLDGLRGQFEEKTRNYSKQIAEKFAGELLDRFRPKIRIMITNLIENYEKELEEVHFMEGIDNLFFDLSHPTENFKHLAARVKLEHVGRLAIFYRSLNYDIPERKQRIDAFTSRLEGRIGEDVTKRL
jgi:hypothetical protein